MPLPVLSRLRPRPVLLERSDLIDTALKVARKPSTLAELPAGQREQVEQVYKALQVSSGWSKRLSNPIHAARAKPVSASVVARGAHAVLGPSSSLTPVDIAEAMVAQGMDYIEPFAPGQPLVPYYGYGRRPRQFDYQVGRNVTTETRPDRIPFETLDRLYKSYDVAQICTRHAINSLRAMVRSMHFGPALGCERYPAREIVEAQRRLRRPDGIRLFPNWLAMNMLNLWKFDSAPIFRLRDRAGNVRSLKNISPKTIAPMLDYFGDFPESPAPAFQQFIEGVPWDWLSWDDIIYEPFWPETDSPYGTPPLETTLVNANTDVRMQLFFLQFFTAGQVPEAFATAPEDMSSPDDLADFQEQYDAETTGDQAERYGLRWLPHGTEIIQYKPQQFDPDLAEYVMRRTVSSYLETPHNVGLTDSINRSTGDTQMDVEERITDVPLAGYYEGLIDSILQDDWGLPVAIHLDVRVDRKDELQEAQARQIYWRMAALRSTDVRNKLGYPVDPREQSPLGMMDERLGWIPMAHALAVAGDIDDVTGMPEPGSVEPIPYQLPGGGTPVPAEGPGGGGADPKAPHPSAGDPTKAYPRPLQAPSSAASKEALPDEQQGDSRPLLALPSGSADPAPGYGFFPGSSGQGTGLIVHPEGEGEDPVAAEADDDLRRWRANARKQVARGRRPRRFADSALPPGRVAAVWAALESATTRDEVDAAFKSGHPKAAGVVVQAADSGRVLMVRRTPDKHDPDEAYARVEFPGGRLDEGESAWSGARREWSEETGATLPPSVRHLGNWTSPDGVYVGFVVEVPREADIALHPDPDEVSGAQWRSKDDLDAPEVRDKVTETLDRVTPLLKAWRDQPRNHLGQFSTHETLEWSGFHRHTDVIVDHYAPKIEAALAGVLDSGFLHHVAEVAYGHVEKARQKPSGRGSGLPPNQAAAVAAGVTAGAGAVGAAAASGAAGTAAVTVAGGAAVGVAQAGGLAAAVALLASAPLAIDALRSLLTRLYGDAYLQGAHEAAESSGGEMPPWTATVPVPDGYWTHWTEGVGEEAAQVGGGDFAQLMRDAGRWAREIAKTELDRIAEALTDAVEQGRPLTDAVATIEAVVHDHERAWMIAETEYARAVTLARRETYRVNNVPMVRWLHQPGACPRCMENAAASPIPLTATWPQGDVPVHPLCRCVEAPYRPRRSR